jgi:DNA-binding NtrC family response regulator
MGFQAACKDFRGRGAEIGDMDSTQAVERPVVSLLWDELREYRRRREAWEGELQRLLEARRELEARHWQLVLHAIEVATSVGEARPALLPLLGEGPGFEERMALVERSLIDAALARTGGCSRRAAALLGLLPTTLCEKLKRRGGSDYAH